MKIDVYDSPQAQNAQLDGARLNPGAAPNPMGAIGQGLQNAAEGFDQIVLQAQTLKGEEALNPFREKVLELTERVKALRGKQAFDPAAYGGDPGASLHKTALGWFDAEAGEAKMQLTGHAAEVFKAGAARWRLEFDGHVLDHEGRETAVVAKDAYAGAFAVEVQNISQNGLSPDGRIQSDTIAQSINRKVYAAQQLSDFLGEGPDTRQARELEARSGGHALVLDTLLKRNNAPGAQAYFDLNRNQMDPKVASFMEAQIAKDVRGLQVGRVVAEVWAKGGPQGDTAAVNLDAMAEAVRTRFTNDPDAQRIALASLKDRAQEHDYSVKQREDATMGSIWGQVLAGKGARAIQGLPEFRRLDGARQAQVVAQVEAFRNRNENDPATVVERNLAYFNLVRRPDFANLTDNQIRAMAPLLGSSLTVEVMKDLQKIRTNPEKLQEVKLDMDVILSEAKDYGLIKGNQVTEADKLKLAPLFARMKMLQQASGRQWSYEETQKRVRDLMTAVVTDRAGWAEKAWSHVPFTNKDQDSKKPLFEVEQKNPVPHDFAAVTYFRAAQSGRTELTRTEVYNLYQEAKEKGLIGPKGEIKNLEPEISEALAILTRNGVAVTGANIQVMVNAIREKKGK